MGAEVPCLKITLALSMRDLAHGAVPGCGNAGVNPGVLPAGPGDRTQRQVCYLGNTVAGIVQNTTKKVKQRANSLIEGIVGVTTGGVRKWSLKK
jgi:hypothetical protein